MVAQAQIGIFDDSGPACDFQQQSDEPDAKEHWQATTVYLTAYDGSQQVLEVDGVAENDFKGVGDNWWSWGVATWAAEVDLYMTWGGLGAANGYTDVTVTVTTGGGTLLTPNGISINQEIDPPAGNQWHGQEFKYLGPFTNVDGAFVVALTDNGVPDGLIIAADAVLAVPRTTIANDEPGSWVNRIENGFSTGSLLDMTHPDGPWQAVKIDVIDNASELTEEFLKLDWDDSDLIIDVWYSQDMITPIDPGTSWDISSTSFPFTLYVEGTADEGGGRVELELSVVDSLGQPIIDRPIEDILVIWVTN